MRLSPALTLVEMIVVMAILSIILVASSLNITSILNRNQLRNATETLANALRQARIYSRENKEVSTWKVSSSSPNTYILSKSDGTNPTSYQLSPNISFNNFSITFEKNTGYTTGTTITLTDSKSSKTSQIIVSSFGSIEPNYPN